MIDSTLNIENYFKDLEAYLSPHSSELSPVVIKYGGSAMLDDKQRQAFYCQLVFLTEQGHSFILVHGGGSQINAELHAAGLKPTFHQGLRVTDDATMTILERVLVEQVNSQIVNEINDCWNHYTNHHSRMAVGLDSRNLLQSTPLNPALGRVGKVEKVDRHQIVKSLQTSPIVVLPPVGSDKQDRLSYNINADWAASSVAIAMAVSQLIYITDEAGILDHKGNLIANLNLEALMKLQDTGTISAGMIPKSQSIMAAIHQGVKSVRIVDGAGDYFLCRILANNDKLGTLIRS